MGTQQSIGDATRVTERARSGSRVELDADIPDGWQQGPGAYGGLVLATLARALDVAQADAGRSLRALQGEILAPVPVGAARIDAEVLRVGKGLTFADARLRSGADVVARASATFGGPRAAVGPLAPAPPPVARMDDVEPLIAGPPLAPVFLQNFELRILPPAPFSSAATAEAHGWMRALVPLARLDAPSVIALLDVWMPSYWAQLDAPRPMSTVSFTAEIVTDLARVDPNQPFRYRARTVSAHDGFVVEMRELWAGAVLVGMNQQTFAVIR